MKYLISIILLVFSTAATSLEVEWAGSNKSRMLLIGEIRSGDLDQIIRLIRADGFPDTISIASNGGDVIEAIRIGKFINKYFINVNAVETCNSACFMVWAGGFKREVYGALGLHRPYFDRDYFSGLDVDSAERKYNEMVRQVTQYLEKMHVPKSLIDAMMSADSKSLFYVNEVDLKGKISLYSPAKQEWLVSKCGSLSNEELMDEQAIYDQDTLQYYLSKNSKNKFDFDMIEYLQAKLVNSREYSDGYKNYLEEKSLKIRRCNRDEIQYIRNQF